MCVFGFVGWMGRGQGLVKQIPDALFSAGSSGRLHRTRRGTRNIPRVSLLATRDVASDISVEGRGLPPSNLRRPPPKTLITMHSVSSGLALCLLGWTLQWLALGRYFDFSGAWRGGGGRPELVRGVCLCPLPAEGSGGREFPPESGGGSGGGRRQLPRRGQASVNSNLWPRAKYAAACGDLVHLGTQHRVT